MAYPCREAVINSSYNVKSMSEEKKAYDLAASKDIAAAVASISANDSKDEILSNLNSIEKKVINLSKTLGIKVKKAKKK